MNEVLVLGGYGHLGRRCVRSIIEHANTRVVIAGPSIQRAESLALHYEGRAEYVYADVGEPRTLARVIEGAAALALCCPGDPSAAIDLAIERRVPILLPRALPETRARTPLSERAWAAQVPVLTCSGALPGLPGVLAEHMVRRFPAIDELRIAATQRAPADAATTPSGHGALTRWVPQRVRFREPIGALGLRPARIADLEGFAPAHCVESLVYLEPRTSRIERFLGSRAVDRFALVAEAQMSAASEPSARLEVVARDVADAAAALMASLVKGVLAGEIPAGRLTAREARGPAVILEELEKQGIGVFDG